ncbi:hypothetical protein F5Y08DRAFT_352585 [Xylaria arbuscula]|nr:hypothetical protein F5Y08DRAFT_352585 [Xylaria arbuscula]
MDHQFRSCQSLLLMGLVISFHLPFSLSLSTPYDPYSVAARCPLPCDATASSSGWPLYQDFDQLSSCSETILLDINLYYAANETGTQFTTRACLPAAPMSIAQRQFLSFDSPQNSTRIGFDAQKQTHDIQIQISRWLDHGSTQSDAVDAAGLALAGAVEIQEDGNSTVLLAKSGQVVIGIYAGSQIENKGLGSIIREFTKRSGDSAFSKSAAQLCHSDLLGLEILGIFIDITGHLESV